MALMAAPIPSVSLVASTPLKQPNAGCGIQLCRCKLSTGSPQKKLNLRRQTKWTCTVAAGNSSSPTLQGSEEDDDDDWKNQMFADFSRTPGGFRSTGRDWEDELDLAKEEDSQADWSAKTRQRAIEAIKERELPVGALLDDGKKKKRKKKKKKAPAPAPEMRLTKAKLEKLEKIAQSLDEEGLLSGDGRLEESLLENPLMKAVSSGNGLAEGLAGLGSYWKNLGNSTTGEIRSADAVGIVEKRQPIEASNRIVVSTPKNVKNAGTLFMNLLFSGDQCYCFSRRFPISRFGQVDAPDIRLSYFWLRSLQIWDSNCEKLKVWCLF
jgi:hypothetical protein